jgi:hypothetical protein
MTGGLMQLVAYGAQDVYLTGNPEITFFKAVHKRHTNFACEVIPQTFNGNTDFGTTAHCKIARQGDLVTRMYLRATVHAQGTSAVAPFAWVANLGFHILDSVEIQIGGQRIDKHYSQWLEIWHQLTNDAAHVKGLGEMLGNGGNNQSFTHFNAADTNERKVELFLPLQFWFNRNVGNALPLIALQYHEVEVICKFANATQSYIKYNTPSMTVTPSFAKCDLLVEYIYLDTDERKRFAQQKHEYLIEQVQDLRGKSVTANASSATVDLHFNHPCKALYWVNPPNYHHDINTQHLGSNFKTWLNNFVLRYCANNTAIPTEGIVTYSMRSNGQIVGSLVSSPDTRNGSIVNTAYAPSENENFSQLLQIFNSLNIQLKNPTGASLTIDNTTTPTGWTDLVTLNPFRIAFSMDPYGIAFQALPHLVSRTLGQLDTAGTGANDVFSTVTSTSVLVTQVVGSSHEFSSGVGHGQTIKSAQLKMNGQDRFETLPAEYFNNIQAYQHHSNTPAHGVYMYSFALNPEDQQPSGTCNFSRIDNSQLILNMNANNPASQVSVYAVNYNVLRITSGMGGLAYSN